MDAEKRAKCNANLRPFHELTEEEAFAIRSAGGKASAQKRRLEKSMREDLVEVLEEEFEKTGETNQRMVTRGLIMKAISGDPAAYKSIVSMLGEDGEENMSVAVRLMGEAEAWSE